MSKTLEESARVHAQANGKKIERAFKSFAPTWPTWLDDSYSAALGAWLELDDSARLDAVRLAKTHNTTCKACSLGAYLKFHKWEGLEEVITPAGKVALKPYGKAWCVVRLAILRVGAQPCTGFHATDVSRWRVMYPFVSKLDQRAIVRIDVAKMPDDEVLDGCKAVLVGGDNWKAWEAYHARHDWPFVKPDDGREWVWFPALVPSEWKWFEQPSVAGQAAE